MTSPEEVPEDMQGLIEQYRAGKISDPDELKLLRWFNGMMKVPGFNLRDLLMAGFGFNDREYNRIQKAMVRFRKRLETSAGDVLKELGAEDFTKFIEDTYKEMRSIATTVLMTWREKAIEYGFYTEETGVVDMKGFLTQACNFYIENKDYLETVDERMKDLEAAGHVWAKLAEPNIVRITALKMYTTFITQVMRMAAFGIPVPEAIVQEVKLAVNNAILSTYPQAEVYRT